MLDPNVKCPNCGDTRKDLVKYTWWGGVLGPRMLNHAMCLNCGHKFNGKTGQENTSNIVIYSVVVAVVVLALVGGIFIVVNM